MGFAFEYDDTKCSGAFLRELTILEKACANIIVADKTYLDTRRRSRSRNKDEAKSYKPYVSQHDTNRMVARLKAHESIGRLLFLAKETSNASEEDVVRSILTISDFTDSMTSHEREKLTDLIK